MPTNDRSGILSTNTDRQQSIIERGLFQSSDINDIFWEIALSPPPPINPTPELLSYRGLIITPQIYLFWFHWEVNIFIDGFDYFIYITLDLLIYFI